MLNQQKYFMIFSSAILMLAAMGCGQNSPSGGNTPGGVLASAVGNLQIIVVPEASITDGIESGDGPENIQDGWTISYDKYLVTVGNFLAKRTDTDEYIADPSTYVLDLKNAPNSGYLVKEFSGVAATRWDKFSYDVVNATQGAKRLAPTSIEDFDGMIKDGYSVYFEGQATKGVDTIIFKWGFRAETSFGDCASEDGYAGFAIPSGSTVQIKPTLHGDHPFFDNVTQGPEITKRLAQWMKICNKDNDGELTIEELKNCQVSKALPMPPYDLTGIKDQDADGKITLYDFVDSQMRTFGDYQGDGECPTRQNISPAISSKK